MLGPVFGKKSQTEYIKKIYAGLLKNMSIWVCRLGC